KSFAVPQWHTRHVQHGRNNGCLNCKLIIMGESISYADVRCPQCRDDQEQRRLKY
ncbi:Uncharacterized protein FKW44_015380, partial [Caligus rogercresseyi]